MAAKKKILSWDAALRLVKSLIKKLPRSSDAIAIALYDDKVRKAKCGDAKNCALAQYFANHLGDGYKASVGWSGATINGPAGESVDITFPAKAERFVQRFDEKAYKFLM